MKTIERRYSNRRAASLAGTFTRTLPRSAMFSFARFLAVVVALASTGAAQSDQDLARTIPPPASRPQVIDPYAAAGPTIYVTDASGHLATITLGTYSVHILGSEGVVLTDIGFSPKDGQLYGVSFGAFYRLNRETGKATLIGELGISDANALVFDGQGVGYTEGFESSELYTIDPKTGHVSPVGSTAPFKSAGDLTFYNSGLVLSGYSQSSLTRTTPDTLVLLDPKTARPLAYAELKITNLFGIVCTGKDLLFGFAGTSVYELFPGKENIEQRAVLLKDLSSTGLSQIYGAAYDGYFLY
ncbi:MAG TPA: hypothetical protein VEK33_14080 [Terriglobales bacterium]|nr:hypothetical protein [Terriglobales bacterium]